MILAKSGAKARSTKEKDPGAEAPESFWGIWQELTAGRRGWRGWPASRTGSPAGPW